MRRAVLLLGLVLVAGCGGGDSTTEDTPLPGPGKILYAGVDWAVVVDGNTAAAYHLVDGKWHADRSGKVRIDILGPKPGELAPNPPQVAISMHSKTPLVESALWVDDLRLFEKGGGSPTNGTIYGAPANPLEPGRHVAVGYARTATAGTAVAWVFQSPKNG